MTDNAFATKPNNNNTPIIMNDHNASMMKFQEEVLGIISQLEYRLTSKITNFNIQYSQSKQLSETSIESINTKYNQIAQSIASINVKFDRLKEYEGFSDKAKEDLTTHEIKINTITKELANACYKYDRIFMDNLLLPGFIGDCCKFKTTKEFFNDIIIQLTALNKSKEKQAIEFQTHKEKLETMIRNMNSQVDAITKAALKCTEDAIKDNNYKLKDRLTNMQNRIEEMNVENSKYGIELKEKTHHISNEMSEMAKLKEEIMTKFESEIAHYKRDNRTTHLLLNEYQADFKIIKKKFRHLAAFIKDVRFRSNLRTLIKRNEIHSLYNKMSSNNLKAFDMEQDSPRYNDNCQLNYNNRHNEIRENRKYYTQSAIQQQPKIKNQISDNDNQSKDNYRRSKDKNQIRNWATNNNNSIVNSKYKGIHPIKLQDNSQMNNISCFDYDTSAIIENENHVIKPSTATINELSCNSHYKKEHLEIKKILKTIEAKYCESESYMKNKLNEVTAIINHFIDLNNHHLMNSNSNNLSPLEQNTHMANSRSSSRNMSHNHKITKKDRAKEIEMKSAISCKPLPFNIIDLAQNNLRPSNDQINKRNLNTINRHKAMTKIRGKSSQFGQGRASATIPDDDYNANLHNIEAINIIPHQNYNHNKTSISNNPTISNAKIVNKGNIIYIMIHYS